VVTCWKLKLDNKIWKNYFSNSWWISFQNSSMSPSWWKEEIDTFVFTWGWILIDLRPVLWMNFSIWFEISRRSL
jgi:hypothetical protein